MAFRFPFGAPIPWAPPWNLHRPLGWVEDNLHGVHAGEWAPQMRRRICFSTASTFDVQSWVHRGLTGVPRVVLSVSLTLNPFHSSADYTDYTDFDSRKSGRAMIHLGRAPYGSRAKTQRVFLGALAALREAKGRPPPHHPYIDRHSCCTHTATRHGLGARSPERRVVIGGKQW